MTVNANELNQQQFKVVFADVKYLKLIHGRNSVYYVAVCITNALLLACAAIQIMLVFVLTIRFSRYNLVYSRAEASLARTVYNSNLQLVANDAKTRTD